jgi:uncharacterized membrane protein YfcA
VARIELPRPRRAEAALTGALGGAFAGLTGVGGGAIMVPLLTGRLGLGQHRAHGTSLAVIMFSFAAMVANRIDADMLRRIYSVTALLLGIESIYSAWRGMRQSAAA